MSIEVVRGLRGQRSSIAFDSASRSLMPASRCERRGRGPLRSRRFSSRSIATRTKSTGGSRHGCGMVSRVGGRSSSDRAPQAATVRTPVPGRPGPEAGGNRRRHMRAGGTATAPARGLSLPYTAFDKERQSGGHDGEQTAWRCIGVHPGATGVAETADEGEKPQRGWRLHANRAEAWPPVLVVTRDAVDGPHDGSSGDPDVHRRKRCWCLRRDGMSSARAPGHFYFAGPGTFLSGCNIPRCRLRHPDLRPWPRAVSYFKVAHKSRLDHPI